MLLSLAACSVSGLSAQQTKAEKKAAQAAKVKSWMDNQNYTFVAQSALPMGGRLRQLTSEYDVRVTKDSVVSYLPYFGRAYTAPLDPTKLPLDFKSKDFTYTITPRKKDGWDITIKPKDVQDVQSLQITVSSDGYSSLQVTSTSRQPISFNGYVTEIRTKKKK